MALLTADKPNRTRLTLLDIFPRGTHGAGNEPSKGTGSDVPLIVKIPTATQTVDAFQVQGQGVNAAPTVLASIDVKGGLILGSALKCSQRVAACPVTAANIKAMYTTPVLLLAAPANTLGFVISQLVFVMTTTATAFTAGGVVVFQYDTTANGAGTSAVVGNLLAAVVTAGAGTSITAFYNASGANGITIPSGGTTASGIYISNQTQLFASGTGTAMVYISYDLITP